MNHVSTQCIPRFTFKSQNRRILCCNSENIFLKTLQIAALKLQRNDTGDAFLIYQTRPLYIEQRNLSKMIKVTTNYNLIATFKNQERKCEIRE